MVLDCMGYDPDAVLQKLEANKTIYAYFNRPEIGRLAGWPSEVRRIKGGIEVDIFTLEDKPGFFLANQAGKLDLSIAGSKSANDFSISWLNIQPKKGTTR
jgi:hypothetical protein